MSVLCCPHHRRADLTAVVRIRAGFDQRARDFVISLGTCVRQRSCPVLRTVGMRHTSALGEKILDTIQMFELDREMQRLSSELLRFGNLTIYLLDQDFAYFEFTTLCSVHEGCTCCVRA